MGMVVLVTCCVPTLFYAVYRVGKFFGQLALDIAFAFLGDDVLDKTFAGFKIVPEFFALKFLGAVFEFRSSD